MIKAPSFIPPTFMPAQPSVVNFLQACDTSLISPTEEARRFPTGRAHSSRVRYYEVQSDSKYGSDMQLILDDSECRHLVSEYGSGDAKYGVDNFITNVSGIGNTNDLPEPIQKALLFARKKEQRGNLFGGIAVLYNLIESMLYYSNFAIKNFSTACHERGIRTCCNMEGEDYVQMLTMEEIYGAITKHREMKGAESKREHEKMQQFMDKVHAKALEQTIDLPGDYSLDVRSIANEKGFFVEITSWTYLSDEEFERHAIDEEDFDYDTVPRPTIRYQDKPLSWLEEEAHDGGGVSFYYELNLPRTKDGDGKHEFEVEMPNGTKRFFFVDEAVAGKNSAK